MTMLWACDVMQTKVVTVKADLPVTSRSSCHEKAFRGCRWSKAPGWWGLCPEPMSCVPLRKPWGAPRRHWPTYREVAGAAPDSGAVARMAGERAAAMRVRDIMTTDLIAVPVDRPVREIARDLVARDMHRVLVTEGRRLLGLVTTVDLVRAIAEGRLT